MGTTLVLVSGYGYYGYYGYYYWFCITFSKFANISYYWEAFNEGGYCIVLKCSD